MKWLVVYFKNNKDETHTGGLYHSHDHGKNIFGINIGGSPKNQRLSPGEDDDNVMFWASYAYKVLKRNPWQSAKINSNQAGILYKNFKEKKLNKQNNFYTLPFLGYRVKKIPGF